AAVAGNFQSGRSMERHRKVGGEQKSPRFALYGHREGFDDVFLIGVAEERPGAEKQAQRHVDRWFATVVPAHAKSRLGKVGRVLLGDGEGNAADHGGTEVAPPHSPGLVRFEGEGPLVATHLGAVGSDVASRAVNYLEHLLGWLRLLRPALERPRQMFDPWQYLPEDKVAGAVHRAAVVEPHALFK